MNSFLRHLPPGQQVGLLFVLVFGTLLLATAVAFGLSLRDRREDDVQSRRPQEFNTVLSTSWAMSRIS